MPIWSTFFHLHRLGLLCCKMMRPTFYYSPFRQKSCFFVFLCLRNGQAMERFVSSLILLFSLSAPLFAVTINVEQRTEGGRTVVAQNAKIRGLLDAHLHAADDAPRRHQHVVLSAIRRKKRKLRNRKLAFFIGQRRTVWQWRKTIRCCGE